MEPLGFHQWGYRVLRRHYPSVAYDPKADYWFLGQAYPSWPRTLVQDVAAYMGVYKQYDLGGNLSLDKHHELIQRFDLDLNHSDDRVIAATVEAAEKQLEQIADGQAMHISYDDMCLGTHTIAVAHAEVGNGICG
jgi:hypothetical protein